MSGMAVQESRRVGEAFTVDDLDAIAEDGLQWELLDGMLLVTPAPKAMHQSVIGEL